MDTTALSIMYLKYIFLILAIPSAIYGFIPYIRGILSGNIVPHPFSWSIWALLTGIGGAVQIASGSGIHATPLLLIAGLTGYTALLSYKKVHSGTIQKTDYIAVVGSLLAIVLWIISKNPLTAAICITLADSIGYIPTFRKGYSSPNEDGYSVYFFSGLSHIFTIASLTAYPIASWLYQSVLTFLAFSFCIMIYARRKQQKKLLL